MSLAADAATVGVLWQRDLRRFVRQRSRLFGALLQPLIFWGMIGGGMASTFRLPGAESVGYMEYFYPGILVMLVLFASIFGTISVVEDRHEGFLQSVLAGPGSRAAVVLGKCLGVGSVGLLQAALFLAFLPFTPFVISHIDWITLVAMLCMGAVGLTAFGFALAWFIDSTQGYHAVMSILLLPAWVLSGAMFPPSNDHPVLHAIMAGNPMAYLVSGVRRAFYGALPGGTSVSSALWVDWVVVGGFALGSLALATFICHRRR